LFNRVAVRISHPVEHVLAWSVFRRRYQQRALVSHYRRRTGNNLSVVAVLDVLRANSAPARRFCRVVAGSEGPTRGAVRD
jgi:hypothetical protein